MLTPAVAGFLYNPKKGEVLLHHRDGNTKFNPNKWAFFGGSFEVEEAPEGAFVRELREETDVVIALSNVIPLRDYVVEEMAMHLYVFYAEGEVEASKMIVGEGAGLEWVSLDEVFDFDITEQTRSDLEYFLQHVVQQAGTR